MNSTWVPGDAAAPALQDRFLESPPFVPVLHELALLLALSALIVSSMHIRCAPCFGP
jgi:hypothetical protein